MELDLVETNQPLIHLFAGLLIIKSFFTNRRRNEDKAKSQKLWLGIRFNLIRMITIVILETTDQVP